MTLFIGLDGEMSDNDIDNGAALIQIGFAILKDDGLNATYSTINPILVDDGQLHWSDEAAKVHNIPLEEVFNSPVSFEVDRQMKDWLINKAGLDPKSRINNVPVGWNVAGFDMPYLKKYLPASYALFSRRTVDLNAICFALGGAVKSAEWWKKAAKEYAEEMCPPTEGYGPHNAGWDAIMSIYCFEYLSSAVRGEYPPKQTKGTNEWTRAKGGKNL